MTFVLGQQAFWFLNRVQCGTVIARSILYQIVTFCGTNSVGCSASAFVMPCDVILDSVMHDCVCWHCCCQGTGAVQVFFSPLYAITSERSTTTKHPGQYSFHQSRRLCQHRILVRRYGEAQCNTRLHVAPQRERCILTTMHPKHCPHGRIVMCKLWIFRI